MYFATGIVEGELAVLDQHHRSDRGDRLRHRIQTENRVRGHRQLGRDVANPEIFEVDRLPVLLDQHDGARNLAGRDLVADVVADALQPSLRKTLPGRAAAVLRTPRSVVRR
jgi:hypothetical protein